MLKMTSIHYKIRALLGKVVIYHTYSTHTVQINNNSHSNLEAAVNVTIASLAIAQSYCS